MEYHGNSEACSCPPMPNAHQLPISTCKPTKDVPSKYFREIGAEMVGNQLVIRMERDKGKSKKSRDQWEPPCDCDTVQIQRPTSKEGPKIINGGDNNRMVFQIHSKSRLGAKDDSSYKPQAISYKVGSCGGGRDTNDQCRTITVYPQLGGPGSQEVHTDHVTEGDQNVFLLRIKKKADPSERKKRNIELELRTPRPPTPPPPNLQLNVQAHPSTKLLVESEEKSDTGQKDKKDPKQKTKKKKKKK